MSLPKIILLIFNRRSLKLHFSLRANENLVFEDMSKNAVFQNNHLLRNYNRQWMQMKMVRKKLMRALLGPTQKY